MLIPCHCWRSACHLVRTFATSRATQTDFDHVIIGGGVVGLAIARQLAIHHPDASILLLERHSRTGTETSSRNSGVIHAGLYHPASSLKTTLCVRGRQLLYDLCVKQGIDHRRTKKWIVAQTVDQGAALAQLHLNASARGVPTRWVGKDEAAQREPHVRARQAVLESTETGIVDVHGLCAFLEADATDRGVEVVPNTIVDSVEALHGGRDGFALSTRLASTPSSSDATPQEPQKTIITAATVINSAGLGAVDLANSLLPPSARLRAGFARGTYFSYNAPAPASVLVYPAPQAGAGGLGTHLTLDLGQPPRVRFGPDVEWIEYDPVTDRMLVPRPDLPASTLHSQELANSRDTTGNETTGTESTGNETTRNESDWQAVNPYTPDRNRLAAALDEIRAYLPSMEPGRLSVDYCGIRPKLLPGPHQTTSNASSSDHRGQDHSQDHGQGHGQHDHSQSNGQETKKNEQGSRATRSSSTGFQDFVIRNEHSLNGAWINLLGIESPGLTSSLAIAEVVEQLLYR